MTRPEYVPAEAKDITEYGAQSDQNDHSTAASNTEAFRSAMDDAGTNGAVYIPEGVYWLGNERRAGIFTFGSHEPSGISIFGDGPEKSVIRQSGEYEDWEWFGEGCQFRGDGVDHGEVVWHGVQFDGNYPAVPTGGGGARPAVLIRGDCSIDLHLENCYIRRWYSEGIRQRDNGGSNLYVSNCKFEENGIGRNLYDGGAGHHIGVSADNNNGIVKVENSKFVNCSGSCFNFRRGNPNIEITNCWVKGTGNALAKLSDHGFHGTVNFSHIYHEASTNFIRNEVDGNPGYYCIYDLAGENDRTIVLNDVESRNHTVYGLRATGSNTVTVQGGHDGPVAMINSAMASDRTEAVRADESSSSLHFDSFGEMSYHYMDGDSSDVVFNAPEAEGEIESLRWGNYEDLGDTGSISFGSVSETNEPFVPDVPGEDEVGIYTVDGEQDGSNENNNGAPLFDDWTPRWESDTSDWEVKSGSEFHGGHALAFRGSEGERTRYGISFDKFGEVSDVEVLDMFRVPSFAEDDEFGYHGRIYLRAGVENSNEVGYWLEVETPQNGYRLAKYRPSGYITTLERFGTPVEDALICRRFRAEGSNIKVKIWNADEPEPDDWDVEVSDSDYTSGWVGLGSFDPELVETDIFSVATNGASAELPNEAIDAEINWKSPTDGETLSGETEIEIDAPEGEEIDVQFGVNGDSWTSLAYDESSGNHSGSFDSTELSNGEHSLHVKVGDGDGVIAESSITVYVENVVTVKTLRSENTGTTTTTLIGEVGNITEDKEALVYFQWRVQGEEDWIDSEQETVDSEGEFERQISDLDPGQEYEFRAVIEVDEIVTGEIRQFATEQEDDGEDSGPSIDQFDVQNNTTSLWSRFDVDWTVTDASGNLDTIISKLRYNGATVAAESTGITGYSESYTHVLRVRGEVDEVKLTVNDTENRVVSETVEV